MVVHAAAKYFENVTEGAATQGMGLTGLTGT